MMQSVNAEQREKRLVENLCKLVGPEKLVGLRFKYRPAEEVGRIFVKATKVLENGESFELKNVDSEVVYNKVPASQLSIGVRTRSEGDPLIQLMRETGMEVAAFLKPAQRSPELDTQSERFGTPEGALREPVSAGLGLGATGRLQGAIQNRDWLAAREHGAARGRGNEEFGGPYPEYRQEVPLWETGQYRGGTREEGFRTTMGLARPSFGTPQGFQQNGAAPLGFQRMGEQEQFRQPAPYRSPYEPIPRQGPQLAHGQGTFGERAPRGRGEELSLEERGGLPPELLSRIASLERKVQANTDKVAMESEIKRYATAIDPFKKRGLFAQHEMFAALYSAPTAHKGSLALAYELGVFLKNRCIKLSYMADGLSTFAQQKVREMGENPTAAQVAEAEKEILRDFQEKRVKAEDVLAKHPEWLREEYRWGLSLTELSSQIETAWFKEMILRVTELESS